MTAQTQMKKSQKNDEQNLVNLRLLIKMSSYEFCPSF